MSFIGFVCDVLLAPINFLIWVAGVVVYVGLIVGLVWMIKECVKWVISKIEITEERRRDDNADNFGL